MSTKIPVPPVGADATREDDFRVYTAAPLVRFLSRGVQPPSQIYLKHTDFLQVACASSQVSESVTFNYRLLRADGALIKGQFTIQVPATRAVVTQQEPMAEGFLLSLSCKAAVATTRGQTFARAYLTSGALGPNQPSYTLMADYVTTQFSPAYPNGRVLAPNEGPGFARIFQPANPPLGNDWTATVPTNARWKIASFWSSLTTGAAVGNRFVTLQYERAFRVILQVFPLVVQAPSLTFTYTGGQLTPITPGTGQIAMIPLAPDLPLLAGDLLQSSTTGLNAGDSWTAIALGLEEWLDNV